MAQINGTMVLNTRELNATFEHHLSRLEDQLVSLDKIHRQEILQLSEKTVQVLKSNFTKQNLQMNELDQRLNQTIAGVLDNSRQDTRTRVTYVRWGRNSCPKGAELVYTGQVGGNFHGHKGGGVNYLCLPNDPENGNPQSYENGQLYGAEYEIGSYYKPYGWSENLNNMEVPCVVCSREQRSSLLMIPGCQTCFKDWKIEYNGYLLSDHYVYSSKDYDFVDMNPDTLKHSSSSDQNGALFYPIRTKCGSLKCPPYKDNVDVYCVICSK